MIGSFLVGAAGYPALEMLWRGRTHWSMALAGGASMVLISRIGRLPMRRGRRALLCGAGITAVEAAVGCLWNRQHQVWDYRHMPMNWRGQVCLPYTVLWCLLSEGVLLAADRKRAGR